MTDQGGTPSPPRRVPGAIRALLGFVLARWRLCYIDTHVPLRGPVALTSSTSCWLVALSPSPLPLPAASYWVFALACLHLALHSLVHQPPRLRFTPPSGRFILLLPQHPSSSILTERPLHVLLCPQSAAPSLLTRVAFRVHSFVSLSTPSHRGAVLMRAPVRSLHF